MSLWQPIAVFCLLYGDIYMDVGMHDRAGAGHTGTVCILITVMHSASALSRQQC